MKTPPELSSVPFLLRGEKRPAKRAEGVGHYRAGELTAVWVPDEAHGALRDLVRGSEAAQRDLTRGASGC